MTTEKPKNQKPSKEDKDIKNQVFSSALINKINKEREWTGGIIVKETIFD